MADNCANNNIHRNIKHDNVHVYVYIVWLTSHSYIMCFSANKELNWIEHGTQETTGYVKFKSYFHKYV